MYASAAYACSLDEASPKSLSTPPTSCSNCAYESSAALPNAATAPVDRAPATTPLMLEKAPFTPELTSCWNPFMLGMMET